MADLAGWGDVLRAVNLLYWLVAAAAIYVAWWWPSRRVFKFAAVGVVAIVFVVPALIRTYNVLDYKIRYARAKAVFDERCKTAGLRIYRTVENVDGITLEAVRAADMAQNRRNPNWPGAGTPDAVGGEDYIRTFLYWEQHEDKRHDRGYVNWTPSTLPGYSFVDVIQSPEHFRRYRLVQPGSNALQVENFQGKPSRYLVTVDQPVRPEDRRYWIAETTVTVRDIESNEVLATQRWHSFEPGLGSEQGARAPWGFAKTCPKTGGGPSPTRFFVDQIVKPRKAENP